MLKGKSKASWNFQKITQKIAKYGDVSGFDRKHKIIFISVCVDSGYIKTEKKINADNATATDVAIAA